MFIYLYALLLM